MKRYELRKVTGPDSDEFQDLVGAAAVLEEGKGERKGSVSFKDLTILVKSRRQVGKVLTVKSKYGNDFTFQQVGE